MKGVPFSNKRYTERGAFSEKMVYKRERGWNSGGASPYKTFLSTPAPPPGGLNMQTNKKARLKDKLI